MAMINNSIISVDDLSFGYDQNSSILSNVVCDISANEFTVIMGKNGSGKSTLLRIMGGIIPYNYGTVKVKGAELKSLKLKEKSRIIGFLPQQHKPVFPFKVFEVVLTGRASYVSITPNKTDLYETERAIELTGISYLKNRIYTELSGGEQQLVMIARLLAQKPEILLLDEPVSHLDFNNQIKILKLIKELVSKNITVVAVLHDPNMAYQFGDRFIYVHDNMIHEVNNEKAWEHKLVTRIFSNDIQHVEHEGKIIFIPKS